MSIPLSQRVVSINPSASIAAKKRVTELQAAGRNIIDFTLGEPDLDTPEHIVAAAVGALHRGDTHYTATAGVAALRQGIAAKLSADARHAYSAEDVVVGAGAKQIIYETFAATLNPGDEVIVPAPYWVSYPDIAKLFGGVPVVAQPVPGHGFKLAPAALEAAITPRTKWLVLNSPNNPSGAVYDAAELRALADVLVRHPHVMLMTDDIYEYLAYDGRQHVNVIAVAPELASRTLLINGFSKGYAMTGWRVGYAAGPRDLIQAIVKLLGQSTTCVASVSQAAAVAALTGDQGFIAKTRDIYQRRRDLMHSMISEIPGFECEVPEGAFYLYPCVAGLMGKRAPDGREIRTDADLVLFLLEQANVAVMDGASYGLSPYLRLSYATSLSVIEQGCRQIRAACSLLR